MLTKLTSNHIYNAATGEHIRYEEHAPKGDKPEHKFLTFTNRGATVPHERLYDDEAEEAWKLLRDIAAEQRVVLSHQADLGVEYGIRYEP